MAIVISNLAALLQARPDIALERLVDGGYLSDKGLAHRQEILVLLQQTQASVTMAEAVRSSQYFEITGPQPTAGFQSLATSLDASGYLSPSGSKLHKGAD